jgi:DNA-binding MarR family transcriptional regulator
MKPGLGQLLRHMKDLVDGEADAFYAADGVDYRPRYTPIMRALAADRHTVGELSEITGLSQGAVSQTIKLMERDDLVSLAAGRDARRTVVSLSRRGLDLLDYLQDHWTSTFTVIEELEREIGVPLRRVLADAIERLEETGFGERLRRAKNAGTAT